MGSKHRGRTQGSEELRRDQLYVADGVAPEEWRRNNALFQYRLIKRTGWLGRAYVAYMVGGILIALIATAVSALIHLAR